MRQGRSPQEACQEAVMRIVKRRREASKSLQVGFLAMNRHGEVGAYAIQHGFSYAICDAKKQDGLVPSQSVYTTSFT
jgi:N4-(beta-N-acetylglucosaminyl)-L-asparaginase